MGADYSKVHRLMRLLTLMQSAEAGNAGELAQALSVSQRTIYRDLEILTELGIPCYFDEAYGGYRVRKDFFLPPMQLAAGEALALLALVGRVACDEQIALTGPAAQAMEKIRAQLPARVMDELGDLHEHIDIRLPATGPEGGAIRSVFGQVQEAIRTRRAVRCRYDSLSSNGESEPFLFCPYALSFDQRAWYALGHHAGHDEVRRLKLNRFTAIEPTDKPYAIPDDFSLNAQRGKAWRMIRGDKLYKVVIDFDCTMAETVADTNWHRSQQVEDHDDGSITFTCEVEGLDEIVWWILGYGPHAVVREPVELIERVAELVKATAEYYARR